MTKTMLICGGDGFIGKNAIDFFKSKYSITATLFNKTVPSRGAVEV